MTNFRYQLNNESIYNFSKNLEDIQAKNFEDHHLRQTLTQAERRQ